MSQPITFTDGPWIADGGSVYAESWSGELNTDGCVCVLVSTSGRSPFEQIANGRLIAQAPEMYKLLEDSCFSIGGDWRKRRDEILQKINSPDF